MVRDGTCWSESDWEVVVDAVSCLAFASKCTAGDSYERTDALLMTDDGAAGHILE